jgi:hypothetical protein
VRCARYGSRRLPTRCIAKCDGVAKMRRDRRLAPSPAETGCVFFRGQCGSLVLTEMMPVAVFALIASGFALLAYRRRID